MVRCKITRGCDLDLWTLDELAKIVSDFKSRKANSTKLDNQNSFELDERNQTPINKSSNEGIKLTELDIAQSPSMTPQLRINPTNTFL